MICYQQPYIALLRVNDFQQKNLFYYWSICNKHLSIDIQSWSGCATANSVWGELWRTGDNGSHWPFETNICLYIMLTTSDDEKWSWWTCPYVLVYIALYISIFRSLCCVLRLTTRWAHSFQMYALHAQSQVLLGVVFYKYTAMAITILLFVVLFWWSENKKN